MKTKIAGFFFGIIGVLLIVSCNRLEEPGIKVGLNTELTGEMPAVGASSKNAATLFVEQTNAAGGIPVGNKKLPLRLIIGDNGGRSDQAASVAQKLISQDDVLAMVGPNPSIVAIPASEVAESLRCLMVAPWSSNPKTTETVAGQRKQYIFRTCFTDAFMLNAIAKFVLNDLKLKRAAVLYDVSNEASTTQSALFREAFEKGGGTITAFDTYTAGDRDFSAQLTKIKASNPEIIFLPVYYNDVALIASQARRLGLTQPFMGGDTWSPSEIVSLAGKDIDGAYLFSHYSSQVPTPVTQKFIADYTAKFGRQPDDVAALTYDTFQLLAHAIQNAGKLDRSAIRDAFSHIRENEGVTGPIRYEPGSGDAVKNAVILRIENGKLVWITNVQP